MRRARHVLLPLVPLLVAACGGGASESPGPAARADGDAPKAPAISGTDPVSGETVSLADFAGRPVILNFWASWCGPCREEIPALAAFAERHPEAQVLGVNYQDSRADARRLAEELGIAFPSVADPKGLIGSELGLFGMPTTFFLDAEHRVRATVRGAAEADDFEKGLELATRPR